MNLKGRVEALERERAGQVDGPLEIIISGGLAGSDDEEPTQASVGERFFTREPDETLAAFQSRVRALSGGQIICWNGLPPVSRD